MTWAFCDDQVGPARKTPIEWRSEALTRYQIRRPFQFINSRIFVHAGDGPEGQLVGETQQYVSFYVTT